MKPEKAACACKRAAAWPCKRASPTRKAGREYAFVDGWSVQFTHYVVTLGDVKLTEPDGGPEVGSWPGAAMIDLKKNGGQNHDVVTLEGLPAKRLDLAFRFVTASDTVENRNVDEDIAAQMVAEGSSVWVEGDASKDGASVHFLLRLHVPTSYKDCINGKDQTKGIAIEANKTTGGLHLRSRLASVLGYPRRRRRIPTLRRLCRRGRCGRRAGNGDRKRTGLSGFDGPA